MLVNGASEFKMHVKHYIEMYADMPLIELLRRRLHKFSEILQTTVLTLASWQKAIHSLGPSDAYASLVQIDNGLSPARCQTIIGNNAGILLIGSLGLKSNETLFEIRKFSFKKIHSKMSPGIRRPCCLGCNVLSELMMTRPVCVCVYVCVWGWGGWRVGGWI